jgi:formylglycine-generating enzyme required for sulfatase activity
MRLRTPLVVVSLIALSAVAQAKPGKTYKNKAGMEFVLVPAGTFMMGTDGWRENTKHEKAPPRTQADEFWDMVGKTFTNEVPRHKVTISKPFYVGKTEVTQAQWQKVMGSNPSKTYVGPNLPVGDVSWYDVGRFVDKLNEMEGKKVYRLPTEAEWEYAAWAGHDVEDPGYRLADVSWNLLNSGGTLHPVATKKANAWGLHDMLGNAWEWCSDWYEKDYYAKSPEVDPQGVTQAAYRVRKRKPLPGDPPGVDQETVGAKSCRGGSFETVDRNRPQERGRHHPDGPAPEMSFRLVRMVD